MVVQPERPSQTALAINDMLTMFVSWEFMASVLWDRFDSSRLGALGEKLRSHSSPSVAHGAPKPSATGTVGPKRSNRFVPPSAG